MWRVTAVLAAGLIALLVYGVAGRNSGSSLDDAVKKGKRPEAPGWTMRRPLLESNAQRSLSEFEGGVVLLNFWASWCVPCADEAPVLVRLQADLERRRLGTVVGASYDDAVFEATRFAHAHHLEFPLLRDPDGALSRGFGTHALPESFLLDENGRVLAVARGQIGDAFRREVLRLAQTASTA